MKSVISIASLICFAFTPTAFAGDSFQTTFEFNRAALKTDEGARQVYADLKSTVRAACRDVAIGRGVEKYLEIRKCAEPMIGQAVAAIGSSRLSVLHAGEEHRFADAQPIGLVKLEDRD